MEKLIDDCGSGEIDIVVIRSVSHIGYDMNKVMDILGKFAARSVDAFFEEENILGSEIRAYMKLR